MILLGQERKDMERWKFVNVLHRTLGDFEISYSHLNALEWVKNQGFSARQIVEIEADWTILVAQEGKGMEQKRFVNVFDRTGGDTGKVL